MDKPIWKHDCASCVFLGVMRSDKTGWSTEAEKNGVPRDDFDLYFCPQIGTDRPTVLVRYGDGPHEIVAARKMEQYPDPVLQGKMITTIERAIQEAYNLAVKRRLIVPPPPPEKEEKTPGGIILTE